MLYRNFQARVGTAAPATPPVILLDKGHLPASEERHGAGGTATTGALRRRHRGHSHWRPEGVMEMQTVWHVPRDRR